MGVYDRQIATAKRLIAAKGQSVTWIQHSIGTLVDANKPWEPPTDVVVNNTVSIVFLPAWNNPLIRALKGAESVAGGSNTGLMAAQTFIPSKKDVVTRGGDTLRIKSVDPVAPNGEIILYTIEFDE